jgi:hypothetical protein
MYLIPIANKKNTHNTTQHIISSATFNLSIDFTYGLFNEVSSSKDIATNSKCLMNWQQSERKQPEPNLRE